MIALKRKIRNILGLVSISSLLVSALLWTLTSDNNPRVGSANQALNQEKQDQYSENQEIKEKRLVRSQLLEEALEKDENAFVFEIAGHFAVPPFNSY